MSTALRRSMSCHRDLICLQDTTCRGGSKRVPWWGWAYKLKLGWMKVGTCFSKRKGGQLCSSASCVVAEGTVCGSGLYRCGFWCLIPLRGRCACLCNGGASSFCFPHPRQHIAAVHPLKTESLSLVKVVLHARASKRFPTGSE